MSSLHHYYLIIAPLLCHHYVIISYLQTINVVADVAVFLQTYTNQNYQMCPDNYKQIKEVLQALTEMCVGNARNQEVILNKHVVDCINRILLLKGAVPTTKKKRFSLFSRGAKRSVAGPKPESVMLLEVKLKAAELLEVMLERTSSDLSENIKKGLQVQLNKDALLQSMVYFRVMKSVDIVKEWDMDDDAERGMYRACHVLVTFMTPGKRERARLLTVAGGREHCDTLFRVILAGGNFGEFGESSSIRQNKIHQYLLFLLQ